MAHTLPSEDSKAEIVSPIWFGLAAIRRHPGGRRRLRIRWLRVLGTTLGLGALAWLLAALALYFFFKFYRGFADERFSDMLTLPFHFKEHDHKMGEYFLSRADDDYDKKRFEMAMNDYRIGVLKAPESLKGRERLADFYYVYNKDELDHSLSILEDGLQYAIASDPDYISNYLSRLREAQKPEKILEICQKYLALFDSPEYLAQHTVNPKVRFLFALNLVSVYVDMGRFDDADEKLTQYKLEQSLEGILLKSELLWECGRMYDAPQYLEKALTHYPDTNSKKYIYSLLTRYYRDLGDLDHALTYILLEEGIDSDPSPRIEHLSITAKSGNPTALAAEEQGLIEEFHTNAYAMTLLASFCTDEGDTKQVAEIFKLAQIQYGVDIKTTGKSDFNLASFALLICETYLTNNQYKDALAYLDNLKADPPSWYDTNHVLFDSMRAVADFGVQRYDECEVYLKELIDSDKMRPDTLMTIANRFLSHGALDQAARLLEAAHKLDPHNQAILAQLISANLQLGNSTDMIKNLQDLLKTHRPPLELLQDAYIQLGSDRFTYVPGREVLLDQINQYILDSVAKHNAGESS
jgi:tetratricopeptide (TPR) repeat protein